jgi:hypothetical protein
MRAKRYCRMTGWIAAGFAAGVLGLSSVPARAQTNYGYYDPGAKSQPAAPSAPGKKAPAKASAPANQASSCFSSQQSSVGGAVHETTCTQTKDGRALESQTVEMTTAAGGPGSRYQEQDESVQVDPDTKRTTKTLLAPDADGNLKPVRVIVEETRKLADGGESVVRTVSAPDLNGRLQVAQKEVTESAPKGANEQETHKTLLMPGSAGQLEPVIKTAEIQQSKGGEVQTHSTQMRPDGNGGWTPAVVEQTVKKPANGGGTTEEQKLYQLDAEGKLQLTRRKVTREWTDKKGEQKSVVETYSGNYPGATEYQTGRVGLVERVSTTRKPGKDGAEHVEQKIETGNYAAPWEGLAVSGQVNETIRPAGNGRVETKREVLVPDGNGRLAQVSVFTGQAPARQAGAPQEKKAEKAQPSEKQAGSSAAGERK